MDKDKVVTPEPRGDKEFVGVSSIMRLLHRVKSPEARIELSI
jgi:hypothetical protein